MKVLILSHNCVSETQNMGKTLVSLFGAFKRTELVQLYLYPSIPKINFCKSYYRITDNDVIRSILRRNKCGGIVEPILTDVGSGLFESDKTRAQYAKTGRGEYMRFARDILWKFGSPKSKALKEWLLAEKPDVVFYALGDAVFSLSMARWISLFLNVPLITYVCDDYFFYGKEKRGLARLFYNRIIRNIKKTINQSSCLVTICDELGEAYKNEFEIPYYTIMTGSSFEAGSIEHAEPRHRISYIGNLSLNRWKSLLEIQEALDKINAEREQKYELVYYGRENDNLKDKILYGGYLDSDGVKKIMSESLLLVHTETFDIEYRARLKYSVSTKVADSLASGTCLLAYAPEEMASMKHLSQNECAYCISDRDRLYEKLSYIIETSEARLKYEEAAKQIARKHHNAIKNSDYLYELVCRIVADEKETRGRSSDKDKKR